MSDPAGKKASAAQAGREPRSRVYDGAFFARFIDPVNAKLHAYVAAQVEPGASVLDVGCGTGALAFRLAPGAREVVGVELSPAMLEYARRRASADRAGKVSFLLGDASTALAGRADGSFDVATMVLVLHEMPGDARVGVLREAARVARRILCIDYATPLPRSLMGFLFRGLEVAAGREHLRAFREFQAFGGTERIAARAGLGCRRLRTLVGGALDLSEIRRSSA